MLTEHAQRVHGSTDGMLTTNCAVACSQFCARLHPELGSTTSSWLEVFVLCLHGHDAAGVHAYTRMLALMCLMHGLWLPPSAQRTMLHI